MPKRSGLIPATIFFGRGQNTHKDAEALTPGQLQSAARVRTHKGIVCMDKGVDQYGIATDAAAGPGGIGVHEHPTAPRLLVAAGGEVKVDSVGDGSVWTPIATGLQTDRDVSFAGQSGITYIANGRDKSRRYQGIGVGGAHTTTVLADLPRPEDCPAMKIAPYPCDNFIDEFEDAAGNWTGHATAAVQDETDLYVQGTKSMRVLPQGVAKGEGCDRDLGAGNEVDMSDSDFLGFWIWTSKSGTWISFQMSEDEATWLRYPITVDEGDLGKWIFKVWDLRSISPDDRDAIRYLRFITMEQTDEDWWLDHLMHSGGLLGEYLYAVSFYDTATRNEGPIGRFTKATTVVKDEDANIAPGRRINFCSRPIYLPDGADRLRLYRTLSGAGGRFYHIADITPVANAWSYVDDTPDKELGEAQVLNQWPGQCPRAAWLIPRGDRLFHVGGLATGARNENPTTAADALNLATDSMVRGPFPPAPIFGVEIKVGTGATGAMTLQLQRQAKDGDWSAATTLATGTLTQEFSATTWYLFPLVAAANEDVFFSDEYEYRVKITVRPAGLTAYKAWVTTGDYLAFRLLVRADNAIFISNLGEPDRIPPLGQYDHEPDEATGGFRTLASHDGQTILSWCDHGSDLLLRKQRRTYLTVGTNTDDFDYVPALPSLGSGGARADVDCDGDTVWMAQDRQIYQWREGGALTMVSKPIEEFFAGLTEAQVVGACAVYFDRRYFLFLPAAPVGSRCRVYDFDEEAWSPGYDGQVYDVLRHGPLNTHTEPWALEMIGAALGVRKLFYGDSDDAGDITWNARSREERFAQETEDADPEAVKRVRAFWLVAEATADDVIAVAFHIDGAAAATRSYNLTIPGTGLQRVEGHPDDDILGHTISAKVSGAHDAATRVHRVELHLELVR